MHVFWQGLNTIAGHKGPHTGLKMGHVGLTRGQIGANLVEDEAISARPRAQKGQERPRKAKKRSQVKPNQAQDATAKQFSSQRCVWREPRYRWWGPSIVWPSRTWSKHWWVKFQEPQKPAKYHTKHTFFGKVWTQSKGTRAHTPASRWAM